MLSPIESFFASREEPGKSCFLFLRKLLLEFDNAITEHWKYGMPFYYFKGKMFCYFWTHKVQGLPYIGIVEGGRIKHKDLIQEKRARMKILLVDPQQDIDVIKIRKILGEARKFYP